MTDPITDMFNRIKNAQAVFKDSTEMPYSEVKMQIAEILKESGFIEDCKKKGVKTQKTIKVDFKYDKHQAAFSGYKRISKPGQRIYISHQEVRPVKNGYGVAIISTPKGLMSDKQARRAKVGGELMVEVW
ncbi:MAG: 30S ribosomal protein S8 [Candidatus Gribaldobacteria bacterium]|nr:30S ribosomal protein S8 [Candidatus Gribaldobacteria bacterium]